MNELRCLRAIDRRDLNLIEKLISTGHDFNGGVGQRKMPPVLYHAVHNNVEEAVQLLVKAGCDVNIKYTPEMKTPLYLSAMNGSQTIATILCENGAEVNEKTAKGLTPLFAAIEWMSMSKDPSIVKTLISFGANVNVLAMNGSTPMIKAIEVNSLSAIKILVKNGANLSVKDLKELKCSLKYNNLQIIEYLLKIYHKMCFDQQMHANISAVDLCLECLNLKAMKLSIELGFKASDKLFENSLILLKTFLPNSHHDIEEAKYCLDYLLTFRHLIDFKQTFAFKYELPANSRIINGNLLTYALLFNCSFASRRLIQMMAPFEYSVFSYYRFNYNDLHSLKLLYLCGIQFPNNFFMKCYPNSNLCDDKSVNKKEFKEFCQWIASQSSNPYSLQEIIRISLRNKFSTNLPTIISHLNLPKHFTTYLLFE